MLANIAEDQGIRRALRRHLGIDIVDFLYRTLRQALSVVVAASLGVAIFATAYFARGFLSAQ
jgi:hypothetical protein